MNTFEEDLETAEELLEQYENELEELERDLQDKTDIIALYEIMIDEYLAMFGDC